MAARWTSASRAATSLSSGGRTGRRLHVNAISTSAARNTHTAKDREVEDRYRCCCGTDGSRGWSGGGFHVRKSGGYGDAAPGARRRLRANRYCAPVRWDCCCCCGCLRSGTMRDPRQRSASSSRTSAVGRHLASRDSSWVRSAILALKAGASCVSCPHQAPSFRQRPQQQRRRHAACCLAASWGCCVSWSAG